MELQIECCASPPLIRAQAAEKRNPRIASASVAWGTIAGSVAGMLSPLTPLYPPLYAPPPCPPLTPLPPPPQECSRLRCSCESQPSGGLRRRLKSETGTVLLSCIWILFIHVFIHVFIRFVTNHPFNSTRHVLTFNINMIYYLLFLLRIAIGAYSLSLSFVCVMFLIDVLHEFELH